LIVIAAPPTSGALADVGQVLGVQLIGPNGVTGVPYNNLTWTVVSGPFVFTSCTNSVCVVRSDTSGYDEIAGMAYGAGPVVVQVTNGQVTQLFQFNATTLPDALTVVSAPASGSYVGEVAAAPFAVQAFFNGGSTPVSGKIVTISVANGSAALAACAGSASCTVSTNASGMISTNVTPLAVGTITLQVNDGGVIASASFTAQALPDDIVSTQFVTVYVAEGATVPETLSLFATDNGTPAAGLAVHWSTSGGFALTVTDTVTGATGASSVMAALGPLNGGSQAAAMGCVWTSICASFNAVGVAAADQQLVILSGGQQTISGGAAYAPLQLEVVDGNGHPVVGASVSVYQTVTAVDGSCPAQGRCPAAPVIASNSIVMTSGSDGMVWVTPLTATSPTGMTQTEIAASVGTQGFATAAVSNLD
jgi:hypothetical protein